MKNADVSELGHAKRARMRVSDVVGLSLESAVGRFDANEAALWAARDAEAIHQARVATRRLRSDLRTLYSFVDARWADTLRGELRWFGAELGTVRDIQVLRDRLESHAAQLPDPEADAARRAVHRLDADEAAARTALVASLRQSRYAHLLRTLHDAVSNPRCTAAADALAVDALRAAIRPTWRRLRKSVDGLGIAPSDDALHEARIRAKRCRYAVEIAVPVFGKRAGALAAHDCQPGEAFALGMLAEIERGLGARARAGFHPVWHVARSRSLRSWL